MTQPASFPSGGGVGPRPLGEPHDHGAVARDPGQPLVVGRHGQVGLPPALAVARDSELGEHDQVGGPGLGLLPQLRRPPDVRRHLAQATVHLGQGHAHRVSLAAGPATWTPPAPEWFLVTVGGGC